MGVSHSVLFQSINWTKFNISLEQKIFPVEDELSPGHNMASSGLRKMLILINFNTLGVWVLLCPAIFMDTVVNGDHIVMADVVAIALHWWMLLLSCVVVLSDRWKATIADVIALYIAQVADVIATDGIAKMR